MAGARARRPASHLVETAPPMGVGRGRAAILGCIPILPALMQRSAGGAGPKERQPVALEDGASFAYQDRAGLGIVTGE